jgi:hypothetical protein
MTSEGRRPLEKSRCRWEHTTKMYLKEAGCEDVDWIHLAQGRVRRWAFESCNKLSGFIKDVFLYLLCCY